MSESSKSRFAQGQSSGQRMTTRFLIEVPNVGWRKFPLGRAMLAYRGGVQLPELAGRTVRVVYAQVSVVGRKLRELHGLNTSEWKFDSEGWIDEEEKERLIRKHLNSVTGQVSGRDSTTSQLTEADISAIRRCLGLQVKG